VEEAILASSVKKETFIWWAVEEMDRWDVEIN
jgi:hypothetical protein